MTERDSWLETVRALPSTWKALMLIGAGATAIATTSAGAALSATAKVEAYSTDAEVNEKDAKIIKRIKPIEADVAELKAVREAQAKEREREQLAKEQDRRERIASFRYLVSLQAADKELRPARKADAAAFARDAFVTAVRDGMSIVDAAEFALDKSPPWRVRGMR